MSAPLPNPSSCPAALLFRAGQQSTSGAVVFSGLPGDPSISLQGGSVVQVTGVPDLLRKVAPAGFASKADLLQDLMAVCGAGVPFAQAMEAAALALGRWLARVSAQPEVAASLLPGVPAPPGSFPLDLSLARMLARGFKEMRSPDTVADTWADSLEQRLQPTGASSAGLSTGLLRTLGRCDGRTLAELIGEELIEGPARLETTWQHLDLLLHLGLLTFRGASTRAAPLPPPPAAPEPPEPPPERESRRSRSRSAESSTDPRITELRQQARELHAMRPLSALGVAPAADIATWLDVNKLGSVFRKVAQQYHPDSFEDPALRKAASEVFSALSEQRERLVKDPGLLAEEIERLRCEAKDIPWAPEADRKDARVLFRRVQSLEENRRWAEALSAVQDVIALDPGEPVYKVIRIWLEVILKQLDTKAAIEQIDNLKLETVSAKVEANYRAGRLLRLAGDARSARRRFERVLEWVPEHVGARREVRLLERRANPQR